MTTAFYRTGTVAVTQNSKVVTGTGTNWTTGPTKPLAGDVFIFNNKMYEIDNVVSDTEIRLYRNFEDSTASSKSYAIMRNASLNISARIAAQVAQVVNQKQIMVDEFHDFLTNNTDSTVPLTDTLGNKINVTPIPMLDKSYVEKIGGIDSAVNQAIQDINDAFDNFEYPVLTAAQRQAIIDANEEKFAASGMVHAGISLLSGANLVPINEGLAAYTGKANTIAWGATSTSPTNNRRGASKTLSPFMHIAGVVSEISEIRESGSWESNHIKLPPAPDGTVIYDSTGDARGTGKANLNLLTEVDHKYGDSAEDVYGVGTVAAKNEACSRAFEGIVKNGDLRLGDNGDWSGLYLSGGYAELTSINLQQLGIFTDQSVDYTARLVMKGDSGGETALVHIGDTAPVKVTLTSEWDEYVINAPRTGNDSFYLRILPGETGLLSSISIKPVTEEVITDRVDMFGLEQFDMVMKDGEIFDMIQSQSSTFGTSGVPTVDSVRPESFFAVYAGQENIVKGKCVKWPNLNRAQKRHIAKYMKERLWINEDGDLTFTSIRQRSFAGAGNGDWANIDSVSTSTNYLRAVDGFGHYVKPQGSSDVSVGFGVGNPTYRTYTAPNNNEPQKGVFTIDESQPENHAYKGRCFFYVLGTVSRLNQGAYAKGLNEAGTAKWNNYAGSNVAQSWYQHDKFKTKADCFFYGAAGVTGVVGGDIGFGTNWAGRPDGRFYDAIYADGLGGVVDYRLPAYESDSPEEAAKAWEKVKNKTYRGLEKLVWTSVKQLNYVTANTPSGGVYELRFEGNPFNLKHNVDTKGNLVSESGYIYDRVLNVRWVSSVNQTYVRTKDSTSFTDSTGFITLEQELNISVSGSFTVTDVIADPANFLEVFPNGIQGRWISVIPDGVNKDYPITRKSLVSSASALYTSDSGDSWGSVSAAINTVKSTINSTTPAANLVVWTYTAFAKPTKPSTNKPVLNGEKGFGAVAQLARADYSLLMESLIGKVGTSASNKDLGSLSILSFILDHSNASSSSHGKLSLVSSYAPKHTIVDLVAPTNNSPAVKALPYQISNNGQCSLGIQANELTYETPSVETQPDSYSAWQVNKLYKVTGLDTGTVILRNKANYPYVLTNCYVSNGKLYNSLNVQLSSWEVWDGSGWGDDGTMKITNSGSDTFVDLNGNTNLSVVHELALPYGWTKNRARAGEQIEGVDL